MPDPSDKTLKRVTARLALVESRLAKIEDRLGIDSSAFDDVPQTARAAAAPASRVAQRSVPRSAPTEPVEMPWFKIFGGIGFLFILLGLFYLYRWGVEQGLLTYGVRIALGIIAGLALTAAGEWVRVKKLPQYGEMLIGGGIAMTYFTVYAAYYFPAVREALGMSFAVDAVLLFVVTALGVWLAFRANSQILTGFAFFLGYCTAFFLPHGHASMLSGIILSIGLWFILGTKQWNFGFAPVTANWAVFFASVGAILDQSVGVASLYALVIFVLFASLALRFTSEDNRVSISIVLVNSLLALGAGLLLVQNYPALRGLFVFIFAIVQFMLWLLCEARRSAVATTYLLLGIAFVTIAIPIQLERSWVTILWAVQGALLIFLGLKYDSLGVRATAYVVLAVALGRFVTIDSWVTGGWERLATGVILTLAIALSAYMLQMRADLMKKYGTFAPNVVTVAAVASASLVTLVECLASNGVSSGLDFEWRLVLLCLVWGLLALLTMRLSVSTRIASLRWASYMLAGLVLVLTLFIMPVAASYGPRTISMLYGVAVVALLAYLLRQNNSVLPAEERGMALVLSIIAIVAFTVLLAVELLDSTGVLQFLTSAGRQGVLSVVWCAESVALLWYGITRGVPALRTIGLILFGSTIAKVLLFDLSGLAQIARVGVTIVIGVFALGISYYYVRHKDTLSKLLK